MTLANKWRPQSFAEVSGQSHILRTLQNSLATNTIHNVYLFSGLTGTGKTTIARILAKALNCKIGITPLPCNKCTNCIDISNGEFIDFIEIDAASRTRIENIIDLLDNIVYPPSHGRFKIYLIDEIHMLSKYSFNALLKVLEEPPSYAKFLLATTDYIKIPQTILSRCIRFKLHALTSKQIKKQLIKILNTESIKFDLNSITEISEAADGSMRNGINIIDQAIVLGNKNITNKVVNKILCRPEKNQILILLSAIIKSNHEMILKTIEKISKKDIEWEKILIDILRYLHKITIIRFSNEKNIVSFGINEQLYHISKTLSQSYIHNIYTILLNGRRELSYFPDQRIGVEITLIKASTLPKK